MSDTIIESIAAAVRRALRGGDLLFRYASTELVVLLTQTDSGTAEHIAERIRSNVLEWSSNIQGEHAIGVTIGVATGPADGLSVHNLVARAREREAASGNPSSSIH